MPTPSDTPPRVRRAGLPPIPFGWYCVSFSDELAPGEVRGLRCFGRDLVLARTEAGVAMLFDAYCPHLGAHLGGGAVVGETLRCPFHHWRFAVDGACVEAPYAKRTPRAALSALPVVEADGFVWAWYHPDGAEPAFALHTFDEIASGEWTDYQKREWTISTHVQETGENAVDSAHFLAVHGVPDLLARPDVSFEGHLRTSDLAMELTRITEREGLEKGRYVDGRILTMNSGPGQTWTRQLGVADLLIIGLPTPIERDRLILRFACSVPKAQGESKARLSRAIIQNAFDQVEQDIPIWEHKRYLERPVLCDGDGPIAEYRRWFAQFYI